MLISRAQLGAKHPKKLNPAEPELSTAWAWHRAALNYEKFLSETYDQNIKHDVSTEKTSSTSLGVPGWALADLSQGETVKDESAMHVFSHHGKEGQLDVLPMRLRHLFRKLGCHMADIDAYAGQEGRNMFVPRADAGAIGPVNDPMLGVRLLACVFLG